jgi:thiosulfate reductase cytochrome b subunit
VNEWDQIQRDDEANSVAESSAKPAIDRPAELPGSVLKRQGSELPSDTSTKKSDDAPESPLISSVGSADDPSGAQANARGESRRDATMAKTVTIEHKHSLAIRWMHWINFPLLALMIYSGLLIYWADSQHEGLNAHRVYRVGFGNWTLFRLFPPWFYKNLHLKFQLAKGLGYHFFFMWLFALNGIAYVLHTFFSGEWRELVPTRRSFREATQVLLHDLGLSKYHPPQRKFNGAQQVTYTGVILMGAGSLLTGLAIYKPTQLHVLTALLGGYETARWFHFWLTLAYVGFFLVHIAQVIRAGWNNFRAMIVGYQISPGELAVRDEVSDERNISAS